MELDELERACADMMDLGRVIHNYPLALACVWVPSESFMPASKDRCRRSVRFREEFIAMAHKLHDIGVDPSPSHSTRIHSVGFGYR
jgi:hypothetical protein